MTDIKRIKGRKEELNKYSKEDLIDLIIAMELQDNSKEYIPYPVPQYPEGPSRYGQGWWGIFPPNYFDTTPTVTCTRPDSECRYWGE